MEGTAASDKEHPLAGAVICFTSVSLEQRTQLVNFAKEMGAVERPDLTSEVTHLLVGSTDSPKYKFVARERNDVAVLKPEWIDAVRQSWMQGGDTDIGALEEQYKMPAFFGLTICISGFTDMGFRTQMHDSAVENGAEFRRDLTKSVTHLIARNAEGEKYKFATQWNIKVVTVKWFHDCVERGMILDEEKYHPMLPEEEQGAGAWDRTAFGTKRQPGKERSASNDSSSNPRPRKMLRRTVSTKLRDQNENIWGDIIGAGFSNPETLDPKNDEPEDEDVEPPKPVIQAVKSFASETTFNESREANQQPHASSNGPAGFLDGTYFYTHGFSSKQNGILHRHLAFNGARCMNSLSEFSSPSIPKTGQGLYIMVPFQTPMSEVPSTDDMAFECEVVTNMWLEKCLHARSLVPPESYVPSIPFFRIPIPGFSGMRISSTGFGGIELLHLSKLAHLMGASYEEVFEPKASVLICRDPQTASFDKLRHAKEWKVTAVSADWLWESFQAGQKKPFDPYIVRRETTQPSGKHDHARSSVENGKRAHHQISEVQDGFDTSETPGSKDKPLTSHSGKTDKTRVMPIIDDGFTNEDSADAPKPSIPDSRSPSPVRTTEQPTKDSAPKPSESESSNPPAVPSALDTALKGLLQQAQAAKSRQTNGSTTSNDETSYPHRRKRKPLLGRAPSHSSSRAQDNTGGPSRASSIDTLNDDGLGQALESADPTRDNSLSRTNSRSGANLSSMFSGKKFDFLSAQPPGPADNEDEENQEPQMTQLDYEDPDAAAMRAEFLRDAGKLGKAKGADPALLLGEVRELEDVGWGSGRRTRKQPPKNDDDS